ncbi:hypothetical protein PBY51_021125 [Eleginops maclovinus]|uniref:Uncharacterized protein n=1 Tax=Eleginops maclovinus TaxID=56733 RepID=A0AAN7XF26_ELEMC|nr:hypothetical protein PBY51_021125 [Eleginops maclovinus]
MEDAGCAFWFAVTAEEQGRPPPLPLHNLHLCLAKAGMALGWWNFFSTDRLWHLALVIFVTKRPPAHGVGHNCHNLA